MYSPASATDADRIIVNAGLYWLFSEIAELIPDQQTKDDYSSHASQCRGNLETILSNLSFHIPVTIDYVLAMSVAVSPFSQATASTNLYKDHLLPTSGQTIPCMELH